MDEEKGSGDDMDEEEKGSGDDMDEEENGSDDEFRSIKALVERKKKKNK